MPWMVVGNCVHKKNADGTAGETISGGCHDNPEEAKRHMRALYANVHESEFAEFSMAIVKTSIKDGEMRWRSVNSDTGEDAYEEHMSKELFEDMIARIENDTPIPEVFRSAICEEGWCGGMPYVSIAHYKSAGGKNVPGEPKSVYLDGDKLKSTGILFDTPLGRAVYKSLSKDIVEKRDDKIRISIGFLDLEHSHGDKFTFVRKALGQKCPLCLEGIGDKIYKKGHLVHLALTRVPANPRTDVEVEKSMTTKIEDAKSIVEDEEVLKEMELKSQADEVLVVKSNDSDEDDKEAKDRKSKKEVETEKSEAVEPEAPVALFVATHPVTESVIINSESPVQKSLIAFGQKIESLVAQGLTGDNALKEIQPDFDALGNVIRAAFTPAPTPEQAATQNMEATLRSLLAEMLPQALQQVVAQTVAPIQGELGELRALSMATKPKQPQENLNPTPRSLTPISLVQKSAIEQLTQKSTSQFARLANVSVGLPADTVR